jgi:iron complex outermembrane recepter protein
VLFPYLKMDERQTDFIGFHGSWKGNRLYYNHSRHLMDNELRGGPMLMVSDAYNTTFGLTGKGYEFYYRNWDTENYFDNPGADMHIDNHLIPDLHLASASVDRHMNIGRDIELGARIGVQHVKIADTDRLSFHQVPHPDAEDNRLFVPFGARAGIKKTFGGKHLAGLQLEVASEAPHPRNLYISVQKPMGKPWWSGNPTLEAPIRATLRGRLRSGMFTLETYGSRVSNYVNLASMMVGERKYLTLENVDAALTGFRIVAESKFLDVHVDYTIGWNLSEDSPLAEIRPLSVETTLHAPVLRGVRSWLRHTYSDAQTRVDESLDETATPAWNRMDLGMGTSIKDLVLSLEIHNLTGETYYEHLSYLRDPFASGMAVNAPGRAIRLAVSYGR